MRLLFGPDARGAGGELSQVPPPVLLGFAFKRIFEPIGGSDAVEEGRIELYELLLEASKRDAQALSIESAAMWQRGLARHRVDVLNKTVALLGDPDPIIAACCAEELSIAGRFDDFRVMRDDFEALKTRFLDVFELGSITLAYLSRLANIAKRGDASAYSGEPTRLSLSKALTLQGGNSRGMALRVPLLPDPYLNRWVAGGGT